MDPALQTISHIFLGAADRPREQIALRYKGHKVWIDLTWQEYYRHVESVALGLAAIGIQRGDRVAILSETRWEWAVIDFAIMGIGAVTVPLYPSQRPEDIELILNNCEAKAIFIENQTQARKWDGLSKRCKTVEHAIGIESMEDPGKDVISWDDLATAGFAEFNDKPNYFTKLIRRNKPTDLATIVYTSGTMGEPKGAALTHAQVMSEVRDLNSVFDLAKEDVSLSFLPYSHVLGRVELWLHTYVGFTMAFAESIDRLRSNLKEVRPTLILGVPRIFEKIYAGVQAKLESQQRFGKILNWMPQFIVTQTLRRQVQEALGGRLRFAISGGAPLEPKIAEFFFRTGLLILEGYGLTETTAAITVNRPESFEFGTAGKPIGDVEIKLADDGEILVKSRKVMSTYFGMDPKQIFIDDYFATGDIGEWTERGNLRITDRKKDLIKTAGGKYIAPQKLEGLLKLNPLISQVLIHGDRRKYIVALITLNESYVKNLALTRGWSYRDQKSLTQRPEVVEMVRSQIADANANLASFETIKNFAILPREFSVESGELTPSLKVKRRACEKIYQEILADL